jgi:hypothetical protein
MQMMTFKTVRRSEDSEQDIAAMVLHGQLQTNSVQILDAVARRQMLQCVIKQVTGSRNTLDVLHAALAPVIRVLWKLFCMPPWHPKIDGPACTCTLSSRDHPTHVINLLGGCQN